MSLAMRAPLALEPGPASAATFFWEPVSLPTVVVQFLAKVLESNLRVRGFVLGSRDRAGAGEASRLTRRSTAMEEGRSLTLPVRRRRHSVRVRDGMRPVQSGGLMRSGHLSSGSRTGFSVTCGSSGGGEGGGEGEGAGEAAIIGELMAKELVFREETSRLRGSEDSLMVLVETSAARDRTLPQHRLPVT